MKFYSFYLILTVSLCATAALADRSSDESTINSGTSLVDTNNDTTTVAPATTTATTTTTLKPVDTTTEEPVCSNITTCEECSQSPCLWTSCLGLPSCTNGIPETCIHLSCANTTTEAPTTTPPTTLPPTTETPTTEKPTESPTTPPTSPPPTETPTTIPPTEQPTTLPVTTAAPTPAPSGRKFDGLSFFGGIIFAALLTALALGGFIFYKKRTSLPYTNFS